MEKLFKIFSKLKYAFVLVLSTLLFSSVIFAEDESKHKMPDANTAIGNQASLNYIGTDGQSRSLVSNIVITRVQQIYSVTITPPRATNVLVGGTALFGHTITNTGNGEDVFDITHNYDSNYTVSFYLDSNNNGQLDPGEATPITKTGTLTPGQQVDILVSVKTPDSASGSVTANITATSEGDDNQSSTTTETINYTSDAAVMVHKALSKSSGTSEIANTLTVYLKIYNNTPTDGKTFELNDILDTAFTYVAGSAKWHAYGTNAVTNLTDTAGGETGMDYTYDSINRKVVFKLNTVPKETDINGTGGYLAFDVTVPADTPAGFIPNKASYKYNNGVTDISFADTNSVQYQVLKFVRATFTGYTIDSAEQGATLRFINKLTNTGNDSETYDLSVYDDQFPAGTQYSVTLQQDDNSAEYNPIDTTGDGNIDTGMLSRNQTINVILYAYLPSTGYGSNYTVKKLATSSYDNTYSVNATDLVKTIKQVSVDLTNNESINDNPNAPGHGIGPEASPVTQITITPNSTNTFDLYVNNINSYISDDYILDVSTSPTFANSTLPQGIKVIFTNPAGAEITRTGTIGPKKNMRVIAKVIADDTVLGGTQSLYFRVKSDTTGATDIKQDAYTVSTVRNVTITPDNQGNTYTGGTIVYKHTVTNAGNVIEGDGTASVFTLFTTDSLTGWASHIYIDTNNDGIFNPVYDKPFTDFASIGGLAPYSSVTIFVQVKASTTAQIGDKDTTSVLGTISQGTYNTSPSLTGAYDTTTISEENMSITKWQSTDGITFTKDIQNAKPGGYIYYKIVVENIGTADATSVEITDKTPEYTSLSNSSGSNTPGSKGLPSYIIYDKDNQVIQNFKLAETRPDVNKKGNIIANVGTLKPATQAVLYFQVKIDTNSSGGDS